MATKTGKEGRFHSWRCNLDCTVDHVAWNGPDRVKEGNGEGGSEYVEALRALDRIMEDL